MKKQVTKKRFLDWYFSDKDDLLTFARQLVNNLDELDEVKINIQDIFNDCGYIPASIVENDDSYEDYLPEDCEIID